MTATATRRRGGTTLARESFSAAFEAAAFVVPARTPNPILRNVLLADGRITGTDMDTKISVPIDWSDDPVLIPADRMKAILSATKGDEIGLRIDGTTLIVTAGRGLWRLPVEDAKEYPNWEPEHRETVVRVAAENVSRAIRAVFKATDQKSARYALSGVQIEVREGVPTFVASDGRRLYWSTLEAVAEQSVDDTETLVPLPGMQAIERIASRRLHAEDAVQFDRTPTELIADIGGTTVISRRLVGKFPRWRDLLKPALTGARPAQAKRAELDSAIRAAAIVSTESSKGVQFGFSETNLSLAGKSSEYGESAVSLELEAGGFTANVKLDPRFVIDWLCGLSGAQSPMVEIRGTDGESAVMLSCDEFRAIVMPLTAEE
jgi:DNA polymerase-3 subunit beta